MKKYFTREMIKRVVIMLISVMLMGVGVQFLNRINLGNDPFSAMNYGVSAKLGISFGTYQAIFNGILFLILFFIDRKLFGLGTIGNMLVVGYSSDFTGWLLDSAGILMPEELSIGIRAAVLVPALVLFLIAASLYINCAIGTSPYDALPALLHQTIKKATKKEFPYRITRIAYDGAACLVAFAVGGDAGIVTVLMVFLLGPVIDFIAGLVKKSGIFKEV